jgi:hypothetical protein
MIPSLTRDSHVVIDRRPAAVGLSPFGWYVVAAFAGPVGIVSAALAIWSVSR